MRVLRRRDARLLLGAALISLTGDWVLRVGLAYYVYALTGSTLASAGMLLASFVPQIALGSLAGVFVDRWDATRTMIVANLLLAAGLVPLLGVDTPGDVWIVYVFVAFEGCVTQFFFPAEQALLPQVVGDADLVAANALNGQNRDLSRLLGSAAGGLVAAAGGVTAIALVDLTSFLLSAVLIVRISAERRGTAAAPGGRLARLRAEWLDGMRVAATVRVLRVVLLFLLVTSLGEGVMGTLFVPFVRSVLHGSDRAYGFVVCAQAAGGIAGGFLAAILSRRARAESLLGWGAVGFGTVDLALFLYPLAYRTLWPAVVLMVVVGLPGAALVTGAITLLQRNSPQAHVGRVFGALNTIEGVAVVAGSVLAGVLGESVGIVPVIAAQGCGYVVAGALVLVVLRARASAVHPRVGDRHPQEPASTGSSGH